MVSLLDFINSISYADDIQEICWRCNSRLKSDLLAPGRVVRPTAPPPFKATDLAVVIEVKFVNRQPDYLCD